MFDKSKDDFLSKLKNKLSSLKTRILVYLSQKYMNNFLITVERTLDIIEVEYSVWLRFITIFNHIKALVNL